MIAVTGAAGFIGGELVAGLNRRGITDIAVVDHPEPLAARPRLRELGFRRSASPAELLDAVDRAARPGRTARSPCRNTTATRVSLRP